MEHNLSVSAFLKCKSGFFRSYILKNDFPERYVYSSIFQKRSLPARFWMTFLILIAVTVSATGQIAGDYRSLTTGNWNANTTWEIFDGATWSPCATGVYPGAAPGAYTVYISGNSTVSVTADVGNSIGALTFTGGAASNIVQFSGTYSLDVTGAVTINPPNSGANFNNGIYLNSGNLTCASLLSSNSANNDRHCRVTISTGVLTVNGNIVMGANQAQNDITFGGPGTLNVTGGLTTGQLTCVDGSQINIGGALSPTAFTVSNSTVNFNGSDQAIPTYTYYNLSCTGNGTKTLPNSNVTVNSDLIVSGPVLAFNSSQARNLIVNGNMSGTGTIDMSPGVLNHSLTLNGQNNSIATFISGAGTVVYSGNSAQQIFSGTYYNLTTQTSNQVRTIQGDVIINNNLTITLGTFDFGNSGAGNVTVFGNLSGAGTINMSGAGLAHNLTLGGASNSVSAFNTTAGSGSTVIYGRAGAQQVFASGAYQNLNITGSGTKTMNTGTVTVNGNLDVTGSSLAFNSVLQTLNVTGDLSGTGTLDMSTGNVAHILNLNGAANTIGTLLSGTAASNVNYVRTGNQTVFGSPNYRNISVSGGGIKALGGSVTVGGTLTLTSGVLQLGWNNLTLSNSTPVAGSPFSTTNMIETDGVGSFIRSGNLTNQSFNLTYPVGSGGYYNPVVISNLPAIAGAARSISIRAVPSNVNVLTNSINKHWDITATNITTQPATVISFQYNSGEVVGESLLFQPYTNNTGTWALADGPSLPGSNPATSTGSTILTGLWTVGSPGTFYSYQSGFWDDPSTWTYDPGGTTGPGTTVPGPNDKVVILSGRTVSLQNDDFSQNLDITINNGGILDLTTWSFGSQLAALRGSGTLKLTSSNFPDAVVNTFVTTDGGTTEYNYNGPLSASQSVYYNLTIRTASGTSVQVTDLTVNGNLIVKEGTFQINDGTSRRLKLIVKGDITVDNTGSLTIGPGTTRTSAGPVPSITGSTGSYLNYYELNSHRIQVFGNFTNNGVVRFSNLTYPVYNSFPSGGFATVYFQGLSDRTLMCNGQTDFYNLIIDKGADQTFKLTVNSSAYDNFRLFGANTSDGSVTLPVSPVNNPNIKKALWIKNGTLVLQGLVAIPSLTEGNTSGAYPSDFFIPGNAALVLDDAGVKVLSTADDYTEINAAYGLSGGSNVTYGINTSGGYSGLAVLGKLQVNNGYLSTRESSGLLYWSYSPGQIIINGGKTDVKQFHNPEGGSAGLISYVQSGGELIIRGRFSNTINYSAPADLSSPAISTARVTDGIDPGSGIGAFNINSNPANGFTMSGGTISVYDVCNTSATPLAFLINCPVSNINVTGGTLQIIPTTGTVMGDANYMVNTTAPVGNFIINRVSGTSNVQLNGNPLVVLGDLDVSSGDFAANNLNLTVGGDFSLGSGTTYSAGTNTTLLNGTADQTFTINTSSPLVLNNLTLLKTNGISVNLAGSQSTINVSGNFSLETGNLNDNGKTINVGGNIYNSGIIAGTGTLTLNGTGAQTIDGNGIFGNVELNNTNVASAPVSLLANMTINGLLTFSQNKLFNINTYNLRLNATSTIVNGGPQRYIQSAGNAGDGGLTKVYSSTGNFVFPVGVVNYTPATISINSAPVAYGAITVIPVNFAHPNVTIPGRSLTYFWRVKSSGFDLGPATVSQGYTYAQSNVVTGAGITENEYVAARFDISASTWTRGTSSDVDEANNIIGEPGSGNFLKDVSFIDGDYTAGDDNPVNPFGTPQIYYSRINGAGSGSGLWGNVNTWSTDPVLMHEGAPAGTVPGAGDIVIIGGRDSVYLATNNTIPNTDVRNCASLKIENGSALDIGYNPNSNFGMVLNSTGGNGNFRLTTSWNSGSTFSFPSGDFSDFNVNLGTTELYSTNPAAGTTYWLPNSVYSYGNLILSPLGGSNIIFPNNDLTIYGNLVTRGQNADSWFCPTWNVNYPTPPAARVAKTITINGDLDIQGGALIWYGNGSIAQNFVVNGDVKVATLSALYVWSGATNQSMSIGGSLINNTDGLTHGLSTRSKVDFTLIPLTFFGNNSASITNTAGNPLTVFSTVLVNKGNSQATTLTCDIAGTLTTPTDNWLTLQNGTFRYMRNNPGTDFTMSTSTPFSVPATTGLYVDLPSNTSNRNILIGNANNNNGDLLLSGKLTIINGNVYVGRTAGNDNRNNDIEYTTSGASEIEIQGGTLMVNGQIRRDPLNAGGVLKYTQSGGTVTINGHAANTTNAKFEVLNGGSGFNMSAGTLIIVRGNGSAASPSSPFGDLYLRPGSGSVTGGTINFIHTGINNPENYFIEADIPLYNITISGVSAANYSTVRLLTSPLVVNGDMSINANSVLNANNINITFNGNLINTPGVGGYVYGTNLTTFNAPAGGATGGAQTVTGATNFYDLVVNPATSLTLTNPATVNRNLVLTTGALILGGNPVTLLGDLTNNASYTDDNNAGSGIILNGALQQKISGSGSFARLILDNTNGARTENNITLQEDLTMTNGILDINKNLLTLGVNSLIQGAPFSATKMIAADGVFSDVGIRKFFNPGATTFLFPIGTSGKYTPAVLAATTSNTVGYVRINNISSRHPVVLDPSNALDYYWEVQSSGITNFSGSLVLNYLQSDVVGDEPNYLAARLIVPGTTWSLTAGVDPSLNTITTNYTGSNNLSGEYTAGVATVFPANVPEYTTNADGNWTDPTIWTQTGGDPYPCPPGGPNGFIVVINHEVTLNANYCSAYRTTINNKLKVVSAYYGHNLGTVDGSGTLYLEKGAFPAGVYSSFLGCSTNSTVEYGGTGTYTIIADLYNEISNITFSGTGTRVLPNKDLTVCNQFIIDGPLVDNSVYNKKLYIKGTMERYNSGAFRSGTGPGATVSFSGTLGQAIGGPTGDFSGTNTFNNLEINNPAGLRVGDAGSADVAGNLLLTNGLINTGPNRTLTITNPAVNCVFPAGGSINSFVDGPLVKRISMFDSFLFPIGINISGTGNILGNNFRISSTQGGPLLWSAQYMSPNSTSANYTAPLQGVSSQEFYRIGSVAGSKAVININWTPVSDVTPLITGGLSNIRLADYNTGTSSWVEIPTSSTGNNSNGTATSTVFVTTTGSDDYTLASITSLKPRAKLTPAGPVCGTAGIPVTFTAPFVIPFDYTLSYTVDGIAQVPVTITTGMLPYTLPTPVPGTYKLTDFTYNSGAAIGVADATAIDVFASPTVADAGPDQAQCGITTATLAANTPVLGTGLWTIVNGSGGTLITPASPTSQFIGLNGVSYTLRWTITNGTCTSFDDMVANFTILPDPPVAAPAQSFCGPSTVADLVAIPPTGSTVDWYSAPSGGVLYPSGTALISGTTYYAESNAGCVSLTRTAVTATVNPIPVPSLNGPNSVCLGSTGNVYSTDAGKTNYVWTVNGGFISSGGTSTDNTATVTWNSSGSRSVSVNYTDAGCTATSPTVYNVTVNALPSITPGPDPVVCTGTTTAQLTYGATTGSPDRYSIVYSAAAHTAGFADVTNASLPASPVSLVVPAGAPAAVYTADITVNNSLTGCVSSTYPVIVTVNTRPVPTFTAEPGATACSSTDVTYTTQAGQSNYVWTISGLAGTDYSITAGGTSSDNSVTLKWLSAGIKTVSVNYANAGGCTALSDVSSVPTTVTLLPVPSFTSQPGASACESVDVTYTTQAGMTNYTWVFTGVAGTDYSITAGGTSSDNSVTLKWLTTGIKSVSVNYANAGGCTALSQVSSTPTTVSSAPVPTFTSEPGATACSSTDVTYTTESGQSNYIWTYSGMAGTDYSITNGGTSSDNSVTLQWLTSGVKTVSVNYTNSNGCGALVATSSTPTTVTLLPVPSFTAQPGAAACAMTDVTYSTQAGQTNYIWTFTGVAGTDYSVTSGGTLSDNSVTLKWLTSGIKTVTVNYSSPAGCTASAAASSIPTTVADLPVPSFTAEPGATVCASSDVTYTTEAGQTNYLWTFTGIAGTDYSITSGGTSSDNSVTLQWLTAGVKTVTVSYTNAGGCTAASPVSSIPSMISLMPTTANAGIDQTGGATCGLTTVTLAANNPVVGTGSWSIVSGTGGTITAPDSPSSTFTGTAGTTYVLRWTISNPPCVPSTDEVTITFNQEPSPANAGLDQTGSSMCGLTSTTLTANTPTIGTGTWSIIGGAGGTVLNPNNPTSTFTGVAGTTYVLRWTVNNPPCTPSFDDVNITFYRNPTVANAGPDQTDASTCGLTTVTLAGNNPAVGTGSWSIISGTGGSFANASLFNTTFTGTAGTSYILRWTISNPPCVASYDDVNIKFNVEPTAANAGPDQIDASTCGLTTVTLAANNPVVGTGSWSIVSGTGGSFANASQYNSTFTGTAGSTYVLRWTVSNPPCASSTDDMTVTFNQEPTVANAGPDQTGISTCGLTTVTLAGNNPVIGTGSWSIVSGAGGSFANVSQYNTTFTGTAGSTYVLRWTISNPPCATSTDDVTVTFNKAPTVASAGPDQTDVATCGLTTVTLAANNPVAGTGSWSIVSGSGGSFANASQYNTTFTGTAGSSYVLRWTITNPPCADSFDDVSITFNEGPTVADAGPDQTDALTCGLTSVTLAANVPVNGTGVWSIVGGTGGTVTDPSDPVSTFSGDAGKTYTLRWTITNPPCLPSYDDVNITFNQNPTAADAGPDQTGLAMCGVTVTTLQGNAPAIGTGTWSIISGTGGNITAADSPTSTFTGVAGESYVLRWTIINLPCTPSFDEVNIVFNLLPVPTFTTEPGVAACTGEDVTYTTQAGQTGYIWTFTGVEGTDYSVTSGGTNSDNTAVIKWLTPGSKTVTINYSNAAGCIALAATSSTPTIVTQTVPVSVSIVADANPVCDGTTVNFTATPVNGGVTPSYQWYNGITPVGTDSPTYSYIPTDGDVITVVLTSSETCQSGGPATSNTVTMTVNPILPVSVSIVTDANPVCDGTTVNFTATPVNGGLTPSYQWYNGTTPVGADSPAYSYIPVNGDVITVVLTSSETCQSGSPAASNAVTMTVNPVLPVSVSIAADANPVCDGTTVNFTATPVNGGLTPSYQWYNGTTPVGTDNPAYSYIPVNGDVITVVLTSSETCQSGGPATSNAVTMTVNPVLPVSVSITADANMVCSGTTVNFTAIPVNGGVTPSYQWYNGITPVGTDSPTYSYIPADGDVITVVLTSSETCQIGGPATSNAVTMTVNPVLPVSVSITADANPVCDGTTVNFTATPVNGGVTPSYQWYNGTTPVGTDSPTYSYIPADGDVITVVLTSGETCQSGSPATSNAVTMTVNPVMPVSVSITADANPVCDGTTVNFTATPVNGGLTPSYQWYNGAAPVGTDSPDYSYIPVDGDVITVVLTSSETCQIGGPAASNAITVTVNTPPVVTITNPSPACSPATVDLTDLSVTAGSSAGLTYTYWTDASALTAYPTPSAAGTGTYYIKGTDPVTGCFDIEPVNVVINDLPMLVITDPAPVCGAATVDITDPALTAGSTAGLDYTFWTDASGTVAYPTPTTATAGTYYIKGTDPVTGCYDIKPVIVVVYDAPVLDVAKTDVSCYGSPTGAIDITVSGGASPYMFAWSGNGVVADSEDQVNLTAGAYAVIVTDANNCSSNANINITEPATALSGSITSQTNVTVYGGNDGSVTADGSGGTAPYQYSLDGGPVQASGTFSTLSTGNYTITIHDDNGCTFDIPVNITQPLESLSGSITSQTNVACYGSSTGMVTVTATGGMPPYEYEIGSDGYQAPDTFNNLAAGDYTITIRDAVMNTFDVNFTITEPASALSGTIISQENVLCFGSNTGSVTVEGSGGTGQYMYRLDSGDFQDSGLFGSLAAGDYIVTIQDENLCTFDVPVTITQPATGITGTISSQSNVSCAGSSDGSVTLSVTGGIAPYSFSLDGGTAQASGTFDNLAAGTYIVAIADATSCTEDVEVTITEPEVLSISYEKTDASCPGEADGSVTLTVTGGTQPFSFIWSDGVATSTRSGITDGIYSAVVTDLNGCAASLDVEIGVSGTERCLEIPDIITPNNDGYNDKWRIKNIDLFPNAEVMIYTRWGKLVFKSKNLSANPWDGTYKGKLLPTDSYHYILHLNDGSEPRSGVISIIR